MGILWVYIYVIGGGLFIVDDNNIIMYFEMRLLRVAFCCRVRIHLKYELIIMLLCGIPTIIVIEL